MSYPNHNTETLDPAACEACGYREAHDAYSHGRVDNFYRRSHLKAVAEDQRAGVARRLAAAKQLTHPSYPMATRVSALEAVAYLTHDPADAKRAAAWRRDFEAVGR